MVDGELTTKPIWGLFLGTKPFTVYKLEYYQVGRCRVTLI